MEESIRALSLRRNALSPISSLPPEIFEAIFTLLCLPALEGEMSDNSGHQARLLVSHVCHQWRQIALNQPLLWRSVDFTTLSLAGGIEILTRAKSVPLYLEARAPHSSWDDVQFNTFRKELQAHSPDVCRLNISAEPLYLHEILGGLASPASTLEYLSLCSSVGHQNTEPGGHIFVPDSLFDDSAPRLSCLKLFNYRISWKSSLLKGLRHLEIRSPIARPKLATWLDALDEMSQLKTLVLHSASPISPEIDVKRTTTLLSLRHLDILASSADCAHALAHLDLPALTELSITVTLRHENPQEVQVLLPHLSRHAHGPQDTQPLQSMLFTTELHGLMILAWSAPDIDVVAQDVPTLIFTRLPPRVALFLICHDIVGCYPCSEILDAALPALPLSGLVTLFASQSSVTPPDGQFWLRQVPKWPLLRYAQLEHYAQHGFRDMLLDGSKCSPVLPLLAELVFVDNIAEDWAVALTRRAELGFPLKRLDLRKCVPYRPCQLEQVSLLSEIVVDFLGPEYTREGMITSHYNTMDCTPFTRFEEINFKAEYDSYTHDGSVYGPAVDGKGDNHEGWQEDGDVEEVEDSDYQ